MHTGELYLPNDDEIIQDQIKKLDRLYDFNMTRPTQLDKRKEMLKEILHYDIRVEGLSGFLKSKRSRLMGTGMDENLSDAERKEEELWE